MASLISRGNKQAKGIDGVGHLIYTQGVILEGRDGGIAGILDLNDAVFVVIRILIAILIGGRITGIIIPQRHIKRTGLIIPVGQIIHRVGR
ncbi:MAG: hypothetical protein K9M57_02365 [Phycisphaerae bacterium]|nr:hypothetical protein [Phycisphaerae bacterium]